MNKRHRSEKSHHSTRVRPWYVLVIAIVSTVVCIAALRANNQHMIELRDAVYAADKDNGDVQQALNDLQAYVTAHMNTNLSSGPNAVYPPIQLKYTYERLLNAQTEGQKGSDLYTQAQKYCEGQNSVDFSGRNRVPCIEQYVQAHSTGQQTKIPEALYKFSFTSPKWSPDLAGWSMLLAIVSWASFLILIVTRRLHSG